MSSPDVPDDLQMAMVIVAPSEELAASIHKAVERYPEAWRSLLFRVAARYSVDVLADVDAVLALAAEARR